MSAGRRPLVTIVPMVVIAAFSTLALAVPAMMGLLTRDRSAVQAGQWWRTLTPALVQPSGFAALVFLLAGLAAVAPPLVVRFGARPVVAGMVLAGLVPSVWSTWLVPGDRGGGSSDVVAGLVGMWAVASLDCGSSADRSWRTVLAGGYGAFFAGYLATVASPLAVLAPLVGNAAAVVAVVAPSPVRPAGCRRRVDPWRWSADDRAGQRPRVRHHRGRGSGTGRRSLAVAGRVLRRGRRPAGDDSRHRCRQCRGHVDVGVRGGAALVVGRSRGAGRRGAAAPGRAGDGWGWTQIPVEMGG